MEKYFPMPGVAWILLTTICLILIVVGLRAAMKRTGWNPARQQKTIAIAIVIMISWMAILSILSYAGFFADFTLLPPRPALAILIPLPFIIALALSKKGTELLQVIPPHWLVLMQSFRIAVELLLLLAFVSGKLPVQMTFEGRNFDIVTGILALPAGYLIAQRKYYSRKVAIAFNIIGLLLLLNILIVAVLSMPTSIRYFMNEPANTIVAEFPFILLPGVLVPIAYGLHIVSLRQLFISEASLNISKGTIKEEISNRMRNLRA